eukprot:TRINITY_DN23621_c0_g1_i1.p1 TRINITY_DN23621_c0_g1~~TRINITY_DN23621_c0_g1_i1.p1  ORF type:complete len:603 (+),score=206.97 TRINITY_DN23621_c0_g1_i1:81-1811(+)
MGAAASVTEPAELPAQDRAAVLAGELSLSGIAARIKDGRSRRVLVAAGAGLSVSAGIPDFRSPGTGLYHTLEKYDLPRPEAVFDLEYFRGRPEPFCQLARELYPGTFAPTPGHAFVLLLERKGLLQRCFTQNIDCLERIAGLPTQSLVEAHGSFAAAACIDCAAPHDVGAVRDALMEQRVLKCENKLPVPRPSTPPGDDAVAAMREAVAAASEAKVAARESYQMDKMVSTGLALISAEKELAEAEEARAQYPEQRAKWDREPKERVCGGLVKPSIVFFGEKLPDRFHWLLDKDGAQADLLIVLGTSLQVMPFAGIVGKVPALCPRLLINRDPVGVHSSDGDAPMGFGNIGFRFGADENYRDVFEQGDCDAGVRRLAALLGWGDELATLEKGFRAKPSSGGRAQFAAPRQWSPAEDAAVDSTFKALTARGAFGGAEQYAAVQQSGAREAHLLPQWAEDFGGEEGRKAFGEALRQLWDSLQCPEHWRAVCAAAGAEPPPAPAPGKAPPGPKHRSSGAGSAAGGAAGQRRRSGSGAGASGAAAQRGRSSSSGPPRRASSGSGRGAGRKTTPPKPSRKPQ